MLIIGIAGGTGSGKTTVVRKIIESLPAGNILKPRRFIGILKKHFAQPGKGKELLVFMACYTGFFLIMYLIVIWPVLTKA